MKTLLCFLNAVYGDEHSRKDLQQDANVIHNFENTKLQVHKSIRSSTVSALQADHSRSATESVLEKGGATSRCHGKENDDVACPFVPDEEVHPDEEVLPLTIRMPGNEIKQVQVPLSTTVETLKKSQELFLRESNVRLFIGERELKESSKSLRDYGVVEGAFGCSVELRAEFWQAGDPDAEKKQVKIKMCRELIDLDNRRLYRHLTHRHLNDHKFWDFGSLTKRKEAYLHEIVQQINSDEFTTALQNLPLHKNGKLLQKKDKSGVEFKLRLYKDILELDEAKLVREKSSLLPIFQFLNE